MGEGSLIDAADLHPFARSDAAAAITFLNEVALDHPEAISFAAGKPYEEFHRVEDALRGIGRFVAHREAEGLSPSAATAQVLQYGPTRGVINDLVAEHLATDEGVLVDPDDIVVTVGCQEALWLTLSSLFAREDDLLLIVSPNFPGAWGCAAACGVRTEGVEMLHFEVDRVADAVEQARGRGLRVRALYLSSDGANPTGMTVPEDQRHALLRLAKAQDFFVLEDNPYTLVAGPDPEPPALKSLDVEARVIRLGTFSKSVFPGARVGYVVADQRVRTATGEESLARVLSRLKTLVTVNTSPLAQAAVGGVLLEHGMSLRKAREREREAYARNRAVMLSAIRRELEGRAAYAWHEPDSGFFVLIDTPFVCTDALALRSAKEHDVIWSPAHPFYGSSRARAQLRLSYSSQTPAEIDEGLRRLARFFDSTELEELT